MNKDLKKVVATIGSTIILSASSHVAFAEGRDTEGEIGGVMIEQMEVTTIDVAEEPQAGATRGGDFYTENRYPLVDPADAAGHPPYPEMGTDVAEQGPEVIVAEETEVIDMPEAGAEGARGEATSCGKTIIGMSPDAVGDPCMTQADFIASLNLNDQQMDQLRAFGMPESSLAH